MKKQEAQKHVSKHLFLCDIYGQEKTGRKFPVLDENWNKQKGLNQCEDCSVGLSEQLCPKCKVPMKPLYDKMACFKCMTHTP